MQNLYILRKYFKNSNNIVKNELFNKGEKVWISSWKICQKFNKTFETNKIWTIMFHANFKILTLYNSCILCTSNSKYKLYNFYIRLLRFVALKQEKKLVNFKSSNIIFQGSIRNLHSEIVLHFLFYLYNPIHWCSNY